MSLSAQQLQFYDENGFLVIEDFVNATDWEQLRARANQLVEEFDPGNVFSIFSTREQNHLADNYFLNSGSMIRCFFEEQAFNSDGSLKQSKERSINKIGHALHDLDHVFDRFSRSLQIKQIVADLKVIEPLLLQSMYIFKQPNIGGEVICHQDTTFLYTEPDTLVGLWFALEDATVDNGCLWAIPGAHRLGLKSRWVRKPQGMSFDLIDSQPWQLDRLIPLEVRKGTLIVLNGKLPHRSLANSSPRSRHAYSLHIIGGNSSYSPLNWLQRPDSMPLRGF